LVRQVGDQAESPLARLPHHLHQLRPFVSFLDVRDGHRFADSRKSVSESRRTAQPPMSCLEFGLPSNPPLRRGREAPLMMLICFFLVVIDRKRDDFAGTGLDFGQKYPVPANWRICGGDAVRKWGLVE